MFPDCPQMVSKSSLGPKRLQTNFKHVFRDFPKKFSNSNFRSWKLKLALAELPLKKWLPRSRIRIWKNVGEIPKHMFEICLQSFGTQRTLRNHFRTFLEHLEAIFRILKKIIFLKIFSNF